MDPERHRFNSRSAAALRVIFNAVLHPGCLGYSGYREMSPCPACLRSRQRKARKVTTLQLLTHGGTPDHTYWDIAPGYSYIDAATLAGYATLSYDRLSTGLSDHPDPLQAVQLPLQVELAHTIVRNLRNASMSDERISVSEIVGVGHSLGGTLTQAVAAKYPKDFDALIIQGTAAVTPTVAQYASTGVASEAF
ncbi:MAG: hypothetical protein LQ345_006067 [Seirophora villosa]|nr:MAG: hypothetical protein LQ345_006067 [Seirophora villosa]